MFGSIEIVGVRELDQVGVEVASYNLTNWNVSVVSPLSTNYTVQFGPTVGNSSPSASILVNIRWFDDNANITFAGDVLAMKKSTLKYTIALANYPFANKLHSLQVVMRASINTSDTNACSSEQYGFVDNDRSLYWMRVRVQNYSVYGHFIQKAEVDERVAVISNTLLNDTSFSDSHLTAESMIGINVPYFERNAHLDPDFYLLVDSVDAKSTPNSKCPQSGGRGKLSGLAIAGIVVLCVAIVAGVVVAVAWKRYINLRNKRESKRIEQKLKVMNNN
ncbi:hypothetical protein SAMD00019534_116360 [Acytostelium subglobosum LB1]|uniref:hypothetical protein n=1 Tax=Acytostelium subglobosum LB1 TaxID=1410327 RepID=UPI000644ADBF|nr:hypothetical protein SAMD00019534_116360 [Acytostelium subglobosum LB1]GAM28460.1 hypothetical protein SAMD00019534_116360 [Acytostelium subglobosum LB1]|eukprot:XP_012748499.1 hypothetical protein SAMD00019534_116360 [Acytostelium subglobosum LB1]